MALRAFGRHLGRITAYRALALDAAGLRNVTDADAKLPTGVLHVSMETLKTIVLEKGVKAVCVARLCMNVCGFDPSVSLHDDWQTAAVIAAGYASPKRVTLFELSVPVVESIGWTLYDVDVRTAEAAAVGSRGKD